ncbi:MAG: CehA/McbA family metallohydrolase [Myxococcota bacterium]
MQQLRVALLLTSSVLVLSACPKPGGGGGEVDAGSGRCEVDLTATGLFAQAGSGASAAVIASPSQLIGGAGATGRPGDVLLQNDKVRVIIEQPGRTIGPLLSGGGIIDADLQRASGEPGHDAFGRMALFYALGRLSSVKKVEVLADGSNGGPAIVAATGKDVPHDLLNIKSLVNNLAGLDVQFVVDSSVPLALRTTTYYVLSPGESRVRALTAFCNDGDSPVSFPLIELLDVGAFEIFNPGPCNAGLGNGVLDPNNDCTAAPSKWFGTQGDGVAYGVRSASLADLTKPVEKSTLIGYGGVVGSFVEGESLSGILTWTNPDARSRPGTFAIRAGQTRSYLRDFVVAEDLADVNAVLLASDGVATGTLEVTATLPGGAPAPYARVSVLDANDAMVGLIVADARGKASTSLAPGTYKLSAALPGRLVGPQVTATLVAGQTTQRTVSLNEAHTLTVTVKDAANAPMPAKLTVLCASAPCAFDVDTYKRHLLLDEPDFGAAAITFVPPQGTTTLTLPPGEYDVVVSRGPEFSTWPDTWPTSGHRVDLRTADATVNAVLGRIVDTTGWMSADLHVHAVSSSDSAVGNALRAANFLAEGVDVLLSTDHEWITDFAPVVHDLGGDPFMATMIGEEITTFSHGHFNAFPLTRNPEIPNGGAFDHAGGEDGPTLRMPQFFSGVKSEHPGAVVQLNHPRGGSGVLTQLKVDTATLRSHAKPEDFFMAPADDATADDTRLFGDGFDAVETANGPNPSYGILNDWMTFLSRGTVRTTTGVSDTHHELSDNGGYARTWAKVGTDSPAAFKPADFAEAIRTQRAFVSNGPILSFTAQKLDGSGMPVGPKVEMGQTLSISPGDSVELIVDVQGLEWMQLNRVELYSHAPGREALNGATNGEWPEGRILQKRDLDPLMLPVEAVPGSASLRRMHVTERFVVQPTADTWFVGMARSTSGRTMRPLHDARPAAWSNAILIDADGSGKYDDFPLKPGQPLTAVPKAEPLRAPRVPTEREFVEGLKKFLEHDHD